MTLLNPFRTGVDGTARVCREKYRRLRRYVAKHPEVAVAAGLLVPLSRKRPPRARTA